MAEPAARHALPQFEKKRRGAYLKVGIAAAAACALLAGGAGTFAAWNDSTTIAGGTVSTGKLDIGPVTGATTKFFDLTGWYENGTLSTSSPTATPTPTAVGTISSSSTFPTYTQLTADSLPYGITSISSLDSSDYVFAPGDVIEYTTQVTIDAQGTNLIASLVPSFLASPAGTSTASSLLSGGGTAGGTSSLSSDFYTSVAVDWAGATGTDTVSGSDGTYTTHAGGTITTTAATDTTPASYTISTKDAKAETLTVPVTVVIQLKPGANNDSQNNLDGQDKTASDTINLNEIVLSLTQTLPAVASTATPTPAPTPSSSSTSSGS